MLNKYFNFICFSFLLSIFFINSNTAFGSITSDFFVTSGTDASRDPVSVFSSSEIMKLSASDDERMGSGNWPNNSAYDENNYLEFIFSPNIPNNAIIENVSLIHEFRRYGAISEAKLEIWDGTNFIDQIITTGSSNIDHTNTLDLTSFVNTPEKINSFKVRFLAYRESGADTTTSHDFIGLKIIYDLPIPPPNNIPQAQDGSISENVDNPINITLLASDLDNDPLDYSVVDQPSKGTFSISENILIYTPTGEIGQDSFTFKANDTKSDSNIATVNINLSHGELTQISINSEPNIVEIPNTSTIFLSGKDKFGNIVTSDNTTSILLFANNGGKLEPAIVVFSSGIASSILSNTNSGIVKIIASSGVLPQVEIVVSFNKQDSINPQPTISSKKNSGGYIKLNPNSIIKNQTNPILDIVANTDLVVLNKDIPKQEIIFKKKILQTKNEIEENKKENFQMPLSASALNSVSGNVIDKILNKVSDLTLNSYKFFKNKVFGGLKNYFGNIF